jgi:isopentenyl-diphosphate delta-isomerase
MDVLTLRADIGRAGRADAAADPALGRVILVDARDRAIGTAPKLAAHRRGLRHRAISVLVRDRSGRLLLQQRAAGKYHSAGLWSNACCSHPRPGEDSADAAARRLPEEMGIAAALTPLFSTHYRAHVPGRLIEDEIVHVYGGRFDGAPEPDAAEAADWCWVTLAEIARAIEQRPQAFTIWFRKFLRDHGPEIARFVAR